MTTPEEVSPFVDRLQTRAGRHAFGIMEFARTYKVESVITPYLTALL